MNAFPGSLFAQSKIPIPQFDDPSVYAKLFADDREAFVANVLNAALPRLPLFPELTIVKLKADGAVLLSTGTILAALDRLSPASCALLVLLRMKSFTAPASDPSETFQAVWTTFQYDVYKIHKNVSNCLNKTRCEHWLKKNIRIATWVEWYSAVLFLFTLVHGDILAHLARRKSVIPFEEVMNDATPPTPPPRLRSASPLPSSPSSTLTEFVENLFPTVTKDDLLLYELPVQAAELLELPNPPAHHIISSPTFANKKRHFADMCGEESEGNGNEEADKDDRDEERCESPSKIRIIAQDFPSPILPPPDEEQCEEACGPEVPHPAASFFPINLCSDADHSLLSSRSPSTDTCFSDVLPDFSTLVDEMHTCVTQVSPVSCLLSSFMCDVGCQTDPVASNCENQRFVSIPVSCEQLTSFCGLIVYPVRSHTNTFIRTIDGLNSRTVQTQTYALISEMPRWDLDDFQGFFYTKPQRLFVFTEIDASFVLLTWNDSYFTVKI